MLLRETDRKIQFPGRLVNCFGDGRNQPQVEHSVVEMLYQRIYGLALDCEGLNDLELSRADPVFGLSSGRRKLEVPLAGKSTLNPLKLCGRTGGYQKIGYSAGGIDRLLCDFCIELRDMVPDEIVLDRDATDIAAYGDQPLVNVLQAAIAPL